MHTYTNHVNTYNITCTAAEVSVELPWSAVVIPLLEYRLIMNYAVNSIITRSVGISALFSLSLSLSLGRSFTFVKRLYLVQHVASFFSFCVVAKLPCIVAKLPWCWWEMSSEVRYIVTVHNITQCQCIIYAVNQVYAVTCWQSRFVLCSFLKQANDCGHFFISSLISFYKATMVAYMQSVVGNFWFNMVI